MENLLTWASAVLATTPSRWNQMAETLPVELATIPPAEGEWSAKDCLAHLVDTERFVFPVRVQALLDERDFRAFNPDTEGTPADAWPAMAAEFGRLRVQSLRLLAQVTPADLNKRARHPELGLVTLSELVHEWAAHDLMHTVQAERALMQPFIRGTGPWHTYFADHVAEAK
jgi:uncharacterized damage-inducible protein DinB